MFVSFWCDRASKKLAAWAVTSFSLKVEKREVIQGNECRKRVLRVLCSSPTEFQYPKSEANNSCSDWEEN